MLDQGARVGSDEGHERQTFDVVFERAKLPDGTTASLGVKSGHFAAISTQAPLKDAGHRIDLRDMLVIPGLVDGHLHLDKSFIGEPWKSHRPCTNGFDVRERVAFEKELLAGAAPIETRATALADLALSRGTMYIRTHVDVDASVGLRHLEAVLKVRERYRELITIEVVAFPQSGILASPGTADLLDQAIASGADLVGGLDPGGFDQSIEGHLDVVFGVAERRGVGVDIHLHDPGDLGIAELEDIAKRTKALGMQGRVTVSHAYALGQVPTNTARRVASDLADAAVAIMTNAPGDRAFPPINVLREAGVLVFSGSDNVRDAWWPYGDADMIERAMIVGYCLGFYTDEEIRFAFDMVSVNGSNAMRIPDYGIQRGARANFVALAADHVQEAIMTRPKERTVYRGGKLIAKNGQVSHPTLDRELGRNLPS
jgi:cytosine/creatinine deaminase